VHSICSGKEALLECVPVTGTAAHHNLLRSDGPAHLLYEVQLVPTETPVNFSAPAAAVSDHNPEAVSLAVLLCLLCSQPAPWGGEGRDSNRIKLFTGLS
jgi:hypothetical protein